VGRILEKWYEPEAQISVQKGAMPFFVVFRRKEI
jgi:hypothetical protein